MVDEERTRPCHWLELVLFIPLSVLTPTVGWHEGHLACKNPVPLIPEVLFWNRAGVGVVAVVVVVG